MVEHQNGPPSEGGGSRVTPNQAPLRGIGHHNRGRVDCAANERRFRVWRRGRALLSCGCIADPHAGCHRRHDYAITDMQAEAAVAAIRHLDALGTPALLDEPTCRAIWRAGRRQLAERVYRRSAGVA